MRGLIAVFALAGCNFVAGDTYSVNGVVRDVGQHSVRLEHGPVPGAFEEGATLESTSSRVESISSRRT